MTVKEFHLRFSMPYFESDSTNFPAGSGIYLVSTVRISGRQTNLIYIGESDEIRSRVLNHELRERWFIEMKNMGHKLLFFRFSHFPKRDRKRVEAALIFTYQPICNTEYKDQFPYDKTIITYEISDVSGVKTIVV